jgi:hypothetical protein
MLIRVWLNHAIVCYQNHSQHFIHNHFDSNGTMNYLKSLYQLEAAVAQLKLRGAMPDAVHGALPTLDMGGLGEGPPPPRNLAGCDSKATRGGPEIETGPTPYL